MALSAPVVRVAWVRHARPSRGLLEELLARATGRPPGDLRLTLGAYGKPRLAGDPRGEPFFNWSHGHGLAVLALCEDAEVGIDVERLRPVPGALAIAARRLSAAEAATLRRVPEEQRAERFLGAWCRHEARLKCLGIGLTGPDPGEPVTVADLPAPTGFVAAVAVRGDRRPLVSPGS